MTRKQKKVLWRILLSAALLLVVSLVTHFFLPNDTVWLQLVLYLVPYLVIGYDVIRKAAINICHGQVFDENFLMLLATVGAFLIGFMPKGEPQFAEAVFVMLFYQTGELFQSIAVGKSRRSVRALLDIRPDTATKETENGLVTVLPEDVSVGDVILVRAGERIPLDGTVIDGTSSLDTAALTGESMPLSVSCGDLAPSGAVNREGVLRIRVTKPCHESTVSRILELAQNAAERKSKSEAFITVFARYYTPVIVIVACLLTFVPPLFSGNFLGSLVPWLTRALTFLIVSCPCALVISVPLSFFGGIGAASRHGILVKGSGYIEALADTKTVAFDKTGTLTKGVFHVTAIHASVSDDEFLRLCAAAEAFSTHPVADCLRQAARGDIPDVTDVVEYSGRGVAATAEGHRLLVGSARLLSENGVALSNISDESGTTVCLAADGVFLGYCVITDEEKPDALDALHALHRGGIRTVLLTGDRKSTASAVAARLGIEEYRAELLPADKMDAVEELLLGRKSRERVAFVGDGINDAPVLARADVGIAMGALGSDAAIEAADVVLMDDRPSKLPLAVSLSRKILRIVRQNIVFAITVKVLVLLLSLIGYAPLWLAIFADVGVAVLAILNAMRTLRL